MANGDVHMRDSLALAFGGAGVVLAATADWRYAAAYLAGGLYATIFTPDDDLGRPTYAHNRVAKKFPVLGNIIELFKRMNYGYMPRHRGVSHTPVVGTAIRLVSPFIVFVMLRYFLGEASFEQDLNAWWMEYLMYFFVAACVADAAHFVRDFWMKEEEYGEAKRKDQLGIDRADRDSGADVFRGTHGFGESGAVQSGNVSGDDGADRSARPSLQRGQYVGRPDGSDHGVDPSHRRKFSNFVAAKPKN